MKKIILTIFLSTLYIISSFAEKNDLFSVTLEPVFGARIGHFGEQVYAQNSRTSEIYKLSELIYNCNPALYIGLESDFKISNFHLTLVTKFFLPMRVGFMGDSDWCQDVGYQTGNTSIKTNYSEHINYTQDSINFEAGFKYDFKPFSFLTISPVISFLYEYMVFSTVDGYCYYGKKLNSANSYSYYSYDDEPNRTISKCSGEIVQLRRTDYYLWMGADFLFTTPDSHWNFFCGIYISPFIYTHGEDDHYMRDYYYIDTTASIFYAGKSELFVKYNFSKSNSIKLSGSLLFTGDMKGTEIYKTSLYSPYQKGSGTIGATSMYVDIQLSGLFMF